MKNTIIVIVATLIIAGGGGYVYGKGATAPVDVTADKDKQASIEMMKKQSASIKQMGELMKSSGVMMQELGAKYKDDMMMSKGKDLEAVAGEHMGEDDEATAKDESMNKMMID